MDKIYYQDLELVIKHDAWNTPFGCLALELEKKAKKTNSFIYHDPKEHLKNFLNAWIVEKAFVEGFNKIGYPVKFYGDDHEYFNGIGHWGVDCICEGDKIEIKKFETKEKYERWKAKLEGTYDAGYDCDVYFIYIRSTKESKVYYWKTDEEFKSAVQIDIRLY